jgi:hypothetical protein
MSENVINCKKCNRVIRRCTSELCPECWEVDQKGFQMVYRTLQESNRGSGIAIDELARQSGLAGPMLRFQCQGCNTMMSDLERRGRYCLSCSEKTATKAGVEVKPRHLLERQEDQAKLKNSLKEALKPKEDKNAGNRRYGFTSRNNQR